MKQEELDKVIEKHLKWLGRKGGKRADLSGADLRDADLSDADLRGAVLRDAVLCGADLRDAVLRAVLCGADLRDAVLRADLRGADLRDAALRGADLSGADLSDADLSGADFRDAVLCGAVLSDADLRGADLRDAVLSGADLSGADLRDAVLRGADLRGADLDKIQSDYLTTGYYLACPETGAFEAWKKVEGRLVKLLIPADAKRSSATTIKCRASRAIVLEVEGGGTVKNKRNGIVTEYTEGAIVEPDRWDEDRWNECSNGIHFFINKECAKTW